MLSLGQEVTLSGETVEPGVDDRATVEGFEVMPGGYMVHLFFAEKWLAEAGD